MVKKLLSNFTLLLGMILAGTTVVRAQSDFSTTYTSNVTFPTTNTCKVIVDGNEYAGQKVGTGKAAGTSTITFPAGTKYIHLHVAGWKNESATLVIKSGSTTIHTISLTANDGMSNNSPFTFSGDPSTNDYYKVITFTAPLTTDKALTFTTDASPYRFVLWGVNSEEESASSLTKIATIGDDFAVTTLDVNATGTFARPTVTAVEGLTENEDYWIEWSSSDENLLTVDESTGEYIVGEEEGSVDVTFSVMPLEEETYEAVSKTFTVNIVDPNRKGTELNPYSVAEVINGTATGNDVYVKGFIVGSFNNGSVTSTYAESNLALADTYDESGSNAIPVQLVKDTDPRTYFNPQNNPWNVNVAQVLVKANVETYFSVNGLKSTSEIQKVAEQVSITSAGMATYYTDCALDLTAFTDMYAYTATVSGSTITFSRVQQVPAETGVLLRNPAGAAASNVVPVATGTVAAIEGNKFVGTLTDITVSDADCYILNNSTTNGLGFYKVKSSGSNVGAHRAYLKTGTDGVRSFIGFSEGEANGIESVGAEAEQSMEVYNLQGVRVAQPTKGLYIMNGKKVIFK